MTGLDQLLRRAGVNRLLAQAHIARIRDGKIAHHAPATPVLVDASRRPLDNLASLTNAFPRATLGVSPPANGAHLCFAAFALDRSPDDFAFNLAPGGAFAIVAFHDLTHEEVALKAAGLTVTRRTHAAGLGHSLAGVKPVAHHP